MPMLPRQGSCRGGNERHFCSLSRRHLGYDTTSGKPRARVRRRIVKKKMSEKEEKFFVGTTVPGVPTYRKNTCGPHDGTKATDLVGPLSACGPSRGLLKMGRDPPRKERGGLRLGPLGSSGSGVG